MENGEKSRKGGGRIIPEGKRFSAENQPPNAGRRPNILTKVIKDNGISRNDVNLVIKNVIMDHTKAEIDAICKDPKEPMLVRVIARAYLQDFKQGKIINLNLLLDRVYGQAEQTVNINDFSTMTYEQKLERVKQLQAERENEERH